jgi:ABC-2 type transport system permease protein
MWALYRKEIRGFMTSLTGMLVMGIFLLVSALLLWVLPSGMNVIENGYANLDGLFSLAPFLFLFLVPAVCMRSIAEEKKNGTLELLLSRPLSEFQIVLSKYLASFSLIVMAVLPTLFFYFSINQLAYPVGNVDSGGFWGSFIGLLFLGASFTAIGLFSSAITDNQIVAFLLAVLISLFFYLGFGSIMTFFGSFGLIVQNLGIEAHYSSMSRGVVDTRDLIYFLSLIALFIFMATYSLARKKWSL